MSGRSGRRIAVQISIICSEQVVHNHRNNQRLMTIFKSLVLHTSFKTDILLVKKALFN